jgi:hypothetical protein
MLVLYGINDMEETFGGLTHLAILTREEALEDLELSDFIRSDDAPARFENRLVVVESFHDLARLGYHSVAEYIGENLVTNFLEDNPGQFYPLMFGGDIAYAGRVASGFIRARVAKDATSVTWYVEAVNNMTDKHGVILAMGRTDTEARAKATALKAANKIVASLY